MSCEIEAIGDKCLVETEYGSIEGILLNNPNSNGKFCAYRGIPYAKDPSGKLRFKVCFLIFHISYFIFPILILYLFKYLC